MGINSSPETLASLGLSSPTYVSGKAYRPITNDGSIVGYTDTNGNFWNLQGQLTGTQQNGVNYTIDPTSGDITGTSLVNKGGGFLSSLGSVLSNPIVDAVGIGLLTGGAGLGLTCAITGAIGSTGSAIGDAALSGAVTGGTTGGLTSAIQGKCIATGALTGAALGGLGGTAGAGVINAGGCQALANAASGATKGALGSAINGSCVLQGALAGGAGSGVSTLVNNTVNCTTCCKNLSNVAGKVAGSLATGAITGQSPNITNALISGLTSAGVGAAGNALNSSTSGSPVCMNGFYTDPTAVSQTSTGMAFPDASSPSGFSNSTGQYVNEDGSIWQSPTSSSLAGLSVLTNPGSSSSAPTVTNTTQNADGTWTYTYSNGTWATVDSEGNVVSDSSNGEASAAPPGEASYTPSGDGLENVDVTGEAYDGSDNGSLPNVTVTSSPLSTPSTTATSGSTSGSSGSSNTSSTSSSKTSNSAQNTTPTFNNDVSELTTTDPTTTAAKLGALHQLYSSVDPDLKTNSSQDNTTQNEDTYSNAGQQVAHGGPIHLLDGGSALDDLNASPGQSLQHTLSDAARAFQPTQMSGGYPSVLQSTDKYVKPMQHQQIHQLFNSLNPDLRAHLMGHAQGGEIVGPGGLAEGGLPARYHPEAPHGHHPEFITGQTGYYAAGRGTGQSDDIPAMLNNGDYVLDADTVAQLGDGSSKAGAQALEHFRNQIPHHAHGGLTEPVPAKIADGEYVLPSSFVTALGGGDNKTGSKLLDKMREELREHKRSAPVDKIPPKAKSPLDYLRMAKG